MKNPVTYFIPLMLALTLACLASDWPQFKRTANRQGCSLEEQVLLPANLCAWLYFGSPIRASAAIVNGKAYAVSSLGILARVDLATNSVDWHFNLGGVNNESSPAIVNGRVYVGSTAGAFYILDAETGALIKKYMTEGAVLPSPLIFKGSVYFGDFSGRFHALDMDGNVKWTCQAQDKIIYSAAADSDWIVFASGLGYVYWVRDFQTRCDTTNIFRYMGTQDTVSWGSGYAVVSNPVIWNDSVYIGTTPQEGIGGIDRFPLSGIGNKVPQFAYTAFNSLSVDTATAVLFLGTSKEGLIASNGWQTVTAWNVFPPSGCFAVNSSPAVIKNCVIFGEENGKIHFCKKDTLTAPNLGGAQALWSYSLPSGKAIEASPAVSGGKVVVGSLDGCLYGFWDGIEVTEPVVVDSLSSGSKRSDAMPGKWTLTAFPNPVSEGRVSLELAGLKEKAAIAIYNISGSLVRTLNTPGASAIQWNMKDMNGDAVSSGSYYVVVRNAGGKQIRAFNLQVLK